MAKEEEVRPNGTPDDDEAQSDAKDPSGFLSEIIGAPVTVKLNSGIIYKGKRRCSIICHSVVCLPTVLWRIFLSFPRVSLSLDYPEVFDSSVVVSHHCYFLRTLHDARTLKTSRFSKSNI